MIILFLFICDEQDLIRQLEKFLDSALWVPKIKVIIIKENFIFKIEFKKIFKLF
jgi:hypothetical protein